ncbi:hypothetical protein FisN_9Lh323 [Fistulifera solaris]|uniref:Myosin motor domain-containing protein n=1 Tax=Fistulifera solaris TaxID=1519565 RepID=A0A1Z5KL12_FISSO|nr:hypothetical protein FisN_9Lh323 [Fistulifera solaris]|eukprot:GAX27010.1 hypothetical protein FisN_9Lh323 [Fistulifera solaris]
MDCDGGRAAKKGEQIYISMKEYPFGVLPLANVDVNGNLVEFADMVKLPYLHEAAILYNLKRRHREGKPYTRTGDIIIAVNPFQWLTHLYTEKKRSYYSNRLVWEQTDKDPRDGMEPHVYEVSALAYKGLAFGNVDQSILVSGESGAGKTETVKIAMNHMASVQQGPKSEADADIAQLDPVVDRVVQSNPLLEAFGNAKTLRNDNSSRFGKYLQLQFDNSSAGAVPSYTRSTCKLVGSKCEVYLLEKNRVTQHTEMERTYHVFYQLLAAPDKQKYWPKLAGKRNEDFKYVGKSSTTKIEDMTDEEHYHHTVKVLRMVGVDDNMLKELFVAIAIVLQCGNLVFGAKGGDRDKSEVTTRTEIKDLAELLGVDDAVCEMAFTERTMKTRSETYKVPLKTDAAKEAADSFAKEVYGKIFLWVVDQVNSATNAETNYQGGGRDDFGIIGLLDIFGFESFKVNRFEQLCINYANEKLQQKFTEDVFRAVQEEYESEGIELAEITYDDNTDVLDLIEGRGGLLAMLNEECVRPGGNDQDFVQKALMANKTSPCLIVNRTDRMSFGVHHYAGKVMYDADKFVSSNQDTLPTDLEELGKASANSIVSRTEAADTSGKPKRQKSNIVGQTIWGKYKTQLSSLMTNLRTTSSRYIRCIKPNMRKVPVAMEHVPTIEQLRCAGVVAAVTLARSAFPNRLDNQAVKFRYNSMWDKNAFPSKQTNNMTKEQQAKCIAEAILTCALKEKETKNKEGKIVRQFVVGHTKSYFRAGALEYLESNRSTGLDAQATTIQKYMRGAVTRMRLRDMVEGAAKREREARLAKEKAQREAQEKAEREAREAREKFEREKAEREKARAEANQKYLDQIAKLENDLKFEESEGKRRLKNAADRKTEIQNQIASLKEQTSEDAKRKILEPKKIVAQQKKKVAEQAKMIDFLKKENKKIRKEHDKVQQKYDVVAENNEKLLKASDIAGDDFDKKEEQMSKVDSKNKTLSDTLNEAKSLNAQLKDECMAKQDAYMSQAETRLEYQKTMARILNMIQDSSVEAQLIEETVCWALEAESESKTIMAALEAETAMM